MTDTAQFTDWLTYDQQQHWRSYLEGNARLWDALARDLESQTDLSLSEYEILVRLSERNNVAMRMSELADELAQSRSRITHTVRRLEERGLVIRTQTPGDGRGVNCTMTPTGREVLQQAAPIHVASVRTRLVNVITDEELAVLGRMFARLARQDSDEDHHC